jgi:hypothetical protein
MHPSVGFLPGTCLVLAPCLWTQMVSPAQDLRCFVPYSCTLKLMSGTEPLTAHRTKEAKIRTHTSAARCPFHHRQVLDTWTFCSTSQECLPCCFFLACLPAGEAICTCKLSYYCGVQLLLGRKVSTMDHIAASVAPECGKCVRQSCLLYMSSDRQKVISNIGTPLVPAIPACTKSALRPHLHGCHVLYCLLLQ